MKATLLTLIFLFNTTSSFATCRYYMAYDSLDYEGKDIRYTIGVTGHMGAKGYERVNDIAIADYEVFVKATTMKGRFFEYALSSIDIQNLDTRKTFSITKKFQCFVAHCSFDAVKHNLGQSIIAMKPKLKHCRSE
jgi:hypothetical protein